MGGALQGSRSSSAVKVSRRDTVDRYYLFKWRGYAVFLHRIHHSDDPTVFHTHPWPWFSVIFGRYTEQRLRERPAVRWLLNWSKSYVPHRVTLTHGPVWTLFFHGRRDNEWGVFAPDGLQIRKEPWRGLGNPERTSYL